MVVILVATATPALAAPIPPATVGELVLSSNTLHSGIPGVRFGFGVEGEVFVDTETQETGGMPYPITMARPVVAIAAEDPRVAWYGAEVRATTGCDVVDPCTKKPDLFLAGTALLEQGADGRWRPVAWHVAKPMTGKEQASALAAGDSLTSVDPQIDKGAEAVAKRFRDTIGDPKAFAASISPRADTLLFGSSAKERWLGGAAVSAQLAKWKLAFAVKDGVQAGITTGGKVAWVAANVEARPFGKPKAKPAPYRLTAIYERTGAEWRVVQLQFSFATNPYAR